MKIKTTFFLFLIFFCILNSGFEKQSTSRQNFQNRPIKSYSILGSTLIRDWPETGGGLAISIQTRPLKLVINKYVGATMTDITSDFADIDGGDNDDLSFYQQPGALYICKGRNEGQAITINPANTYYLVPEVFFYAVEGRYYLRFNVKERNDIFSPSLKTLNPIPPGTSTNISAAMDSLKDRLY